MTQLARNNMHLGIKTARRTFRLKCKHMVKKGEGYFMFNDYFNGKRIHSTECLACREKELNK